MRLIPSRTTREEERRAIVEREGTFFTVHVYRACVYRALMCVYATYDR